MLRRICFLTQRFRLPFQERYERVENDTMQCITHDFSRQLPSICDALGSRGSPMIGREYILTYP